MANLTTDAAGSIDDATPDKSLSQYLSVWKGLALAYGDKIAEARQASDTTGSPMAFTVEVDDTSARLGNLSFNADVLKSSSGGTGQLHAPGDAEIKITNNTSNTVKLNNLIIPTYDAGNVRMNGVLVYGNDDIQALNKGGATAGFDRITTSRTSSRGLVRITSNYDTEKSIYYDSRSSKPQLNTKRLAPDIILDTGAVIENTRGAVEIESASGNIYIRGEINAGSVDILARKGDFVSSYVNGFDHIGGDPASFTDPTDATEAGKGITANGSVSIAARYLNINSTIQSGIADWKLTLDDSPTLTASAEALGLEQEVTDAIDNRGGNLLVDLGNGVTLNFTKIGIDTDELAEVIAQYEGEIAKNPDASPVRTLTINGTPTQVNIKDYLSGETEGRLEFSKDYADQYAALNTDEDSVFTVISRGGGGDIGNIGASYDAKNNQYLVNGASVNGG